MNKLIFSIILLSLTMISCNNSNKPDVVSSLIVDKTKNNYYLDTDGEILDSTSYISKRNLQLKRLKKISSSFKVYEKLEKQYEKNDSVVYSFNWHFSDNIEKIIENEKKVNKNIGTVYPIFKAKTLDGKTINITDFKGKPTLVNLWFTKCKPCIEEMPVLNEMKSKYGERFNFLSVTMDGDKKVQKFLEKITFNFTHIVDSKELTTELGFRGFPVNLFLDKEGVIQKIEGNVPYQKNTKGEMVMSDGEEFINILKSLE